MSQERAQRERQNGDTKSGRTKDDISLTVITVGAAMYRGRYFSSNDSVKLPRHGTVQPYFPEFLQDQFKKFIIPSLVSNSSITSYVHLIVRKMYRLCLGCVLARGPRHSPRFV